jgi:aspartyl-tRNA(Asn)/glutamyl-tRNA(Gln) amidotransferase subunit C
MKSSPDIDVAYVANLARLDLSAEETALFQDQLGDVLKYVAKLQLNKVQQTSLRLGGASGEEGAELYHPRVSDGDKAMNEVRVDEPLDSAPVTTSELRADEPRDWFTAEEALRNAPRQRDHLFIVPKVVE